MPGDWGGAPTPETTNHVPFALSNCCLMTSRGSIKTSNPSARAEAAAFGLSSTPWAQAGRRACCKKNPLPTPTSRRDWLIGRVNPSQCLAEFPFLWHVVPIKLLQLLIERSFPSQISWRIESKTRLGIQPVLDPLMLRLGVPNNVHRFQPAATNVLDLNRV